MDKGTQNVDNFTKNVKKASNYVDNESKSAGVLNFYGHHLPVNPCVFILQGVTSRGIVLPRQKISLEIEPLKHERLKALPTPFSRLSIPLLILVPL